MVSLTKVECYNLNNKYKYENHCLYIFETLLNWKITETGHLYFLVNPFFAVSEETAK